jgi:hypothetical protein
MNPKGIRSLSMALTNVKTLTRSYALDISCKRTQSSDLLVVASCFMLSIIWMGSKVDLKGSPAKFDPFKILCCTIIDASLVLSNFMSGIPEA